MEFKMDLSIMVNGIKFPNPFLLGSGPPGTNARVLAKSFDAGWGGAVAKTISLESAKVVAAVPTSHSAPRQPSSKVRSAWANVTLASSKSPA